MFKKNWLREQGVADISVAVLKDAGEAGCRPNKAEYILVSTPDHLERAQVLFLARSGCFETMFGQGSWRSCPCYSVAMISPSSLR